METAAGLHPDACGLISDVYVCLAESYLKLWEQKKTSKDPGMNSSQL